MSWPRAASSSVTAPWRRPRRVCDLRCAWARSQRTSKACLCSASPAAGRARTIAISTRVWPSASGRACSWAGAARLLPGTRSSTSRSALRAPLQARSRPGAWSQKCRRTTARRRWGYGQGTTSSAATCGGAASSTGVATSWSWTSMWVAPWMRRPTITLWPMSASRRAASPWCRAGPPRPWAWLTSAWTAAPGRRPVTPGCPASAT
mmetsp:Transcript_125416/g.267750  ORF Transcript_125416/g.267750 Transcript_125416/m.267750 type:complete len:206 (-) Transcript_125416:270-887(-)